MLEKKKLDSFIIALSQAIIQLLIIKILNALHAVGTGCWKNEGKLYTDYSDDDSQWSVG